MPDPKQSFLLLFLSLGMLAISVGLPVLLLYYRSRSTKLLPQRTTWEVPFSGWAVLIAFCAVFLVPSLVQILLHKSGFFSLLYGPDFPVDAVLDPKNPDHKHAANLRGLWSQTLAGPIIVCLLLAGFHFGAKTSPKQLGLAKERWKSNIVVGYLGWLVLAPLTLGIFFLAIVLLSPNPDKHPLMDLGSRAGTREMVVFALQAAILWPIVEELVFRGILLPWTVQEESGAGKGDLILQPRHRCHVCYAAAILLSLQSPTLMDDLQAQKWGRLWRHLAPFFFLLILFPFYLFLPYSRRIRRWSGFSSPQTIQAWFGNAIFFAAIHSNVWPSPIALLILGLGLGYLALRTGSIVPSLVVHSLFNAVAVLYQMLA